MSSGNEVPSNDSLYKATFDQAAIGLAHGTLEGKFARANQKLIDMLGYSREEISQIDYYDITHPDDREKMRSLVRALEAGEIDNYSDEKRYLKKDGTQLWVRVNVSLGRDESGAPRFYIAVIEDISESKRIEAEIRSIQNDLEIERKKVVVERDQFFAISSDAMVVINPDGYFKRVNPAMCRILGYTEKELTSIRIMELVHPDDRDRVRSVFPSSERLLKGDFTQQVVSNFENRYIAKDGTWRTFSWNVTLMPSDLGIYATGRDITKRIEHEQVISRQKEQMAAASKMNALGRMAGGVAHEINNPLTIVYGQAFRLKKLAQEERLDRNAVISISEQIEKMSARIVGIINGLRMFAREGSGDPMEFVLLKTVLGDTLAFCLGKMRGEGIEVKIENENPNLEICCRAVQISQVLLNILNNASDALLNSSHKIIRVRYIEQPELVGLEISDSGNGVPADVVGSLFQPFFTTKPVGKGTGLGLSVAKGIIDSHGGKISYSMSNEGGACFTILFPRVE